MLDKLTSRSERNLRLMERMRMRFSPTPAPQGETHAAAWGQAARRCAFCRATDTCEAWLTAGTPGDGYRDFCPNAMFLEHLREL